MTDCGILQGGWRERVRGYLVAETLGGDDGDFIADALVGFEVEGEFWVVTFDNDLCGLLDGLIIHLATAYSGDTLDGIPLCERDP